MNLFSSPSRKVLAPTLLFLKRETYSRRNNLFMIPYNLSCLFRQLIIWIIKKTIRNFSRLSPRNFWAGPFELKTLMVNKSLSLSLSKVWTYISTGTLLDESQRVSDRVEFRSAFFFFVLVQKGESATFLFFYLPSDTKLFHRFDSSIHQWKMIK